MGGGRRDESGREKLRESRDERREGPSTERSWSHYLVPSEDVGMDWSIKGSCPEGTFQWGHMQDGVWPLIWGRWVSQGPTWGGSATDKDPKGRRTGSQGERGARFSIEKCVIFRLKKIQVQIHASWGHFSLIKSKDPSCEKKPKVGSVVGTHSHYIGECLAPQLIGCTWTNFPRCDLPPQVANL